MTLLNYKFDHIALRVSDIKISTKFYIDVLNFQKGRNFYSSNGVTEIQYLHRDDIILELTSRATKLKKFSNKYDAAEIKHLAFSIEGISKYYSSLSHQGVIPSPIKTKKLEQNTFSYFFIFDPDGIKIEFIAHGPKA